LKKEVFILFTAAMCSLTPAVLSSQVNAPHIQFEFYNDTIDIKTDSSVFVYFNAPVSEESIQFFYAQINTAQYQTVINTLISFKEKHKLNDWLYYQLIRKTAQQISAKADNYPRYTLYKWFLLVKSGYDATLCTGEDELFFYVRSDENIYDIPYYINNGKQYVCLNAHDYGKADLGNDTVNPINIDVAEAQKSFSYKVTQMPDFRAADYEEKDLEFTYDDKVYKFKVMVNPQVKNIFANYPVVDFASYFNIPLSRETYSSIIPILKKNIEGMSQEKGVDYLMRFTRYAFLFENDQDNFGKEKRLSPEQTLLYDHSDCDDRAGLFFYFVKEIYNLPMIVLLYPTHVTVAVNFKKSVGKPVVHNGIKYSVCDPTPQLENLNIGEISARMKKTAFKVVYEYTPLGK